MVEGSQPRVELWPVFPFQRSGSAIGTAKGRKTSETSSKGGGRMTRTPFQAPNANAYQGAVCAVRFARSPGPRPLARTHVRSRERLGGLGRCEPPRGLSLR